MTEKELNALYYLNIELERLKKRIDDIVAQKRELVSDVAIGNSAITGMPKNPSPANGFEMYIINRIALQDQLNEELNRQLAQYVVKLLEYERRKAEIEAYIDQIEDEETKSVFTYRCVERKSWSEIGAILFIDRRTASRKFYQYIREN